MTQRVCHGGGLPYRAAWRRRTSPTASTAADASRARSRRCRRRGQRAQTGRTPPRRGPPRRPPSSRRRTARVSLGTRRSRSGVAASSSCSSSSGRDELPRRPQRRRGGERAPRARGRARRSRPQDGLLLAQADDDPAARHRSRAHGQDAPGARHSDSIMLVRTDPKPRPALVPLDPARPARRRSPATARRRSTPPSRSAARALAIRTIREFTGLEINHVAVVDFGDFEELIDAVGGITIDVPTPILSNKFDCPYRRTRGASAGTAGASRRASRTWTAAARSSTRAIRENRLDPSENDITRGERQQAVMQAIAAKLTSPRTLAEAAVHRRRPADAARDRPLDVASSLQLGWVKFRADDDRTLHCRLGGEPDDRRRPSLIIPTEENRNVDLDVPRRLGAAAAAARARLRSGRGCRRRQPSRGRR